MTIEKDGVYQFRLSSNDGSKLYFNDTLLISNDGIHNLATVTAPIQILPTGPHRISVEFFDNFLTDSLMVEYKGPDTNNQWISIPGERLSSDVITSIEDPSPSLQASIEFSAYPNPLKGDALNVVFSGPLLEGVIVTLHSYSGQRITSTVIDRNQSNGIVTIDNLNRLPNGMYIIEVAKGKNRAIRKLIISR